MVKGASSTPKIVSIINDNKSIIDASEYWGLDFVETEIKIKEKYGNVQVAGIGQSGEKLSLINYIGAASLRK